MLTATATEGLLLKGKALSLGRYLFRTLRKVLRNTCFRHLSSSSSYSQDDKRTIMG